MRIDDVKENILKKIKPTKDEEGRVKRFASELIRIAKTVSGLECVLVGSLGKFTWLRGDHDIDLFIMFPSDVSREDLEKRGLELGKKIVFEMRGKWQIKYAEHPYVHAFIGGFDVDIVPCYKITKGEHIKSAVDRSPLHLEHVVKNLGDKQDEVRLLKQFCKGISVYGSDAKHLGFSGYICELLVLKYGSFESVLASAANWRMPQIISFGTAPKKFPHALIIVDPTDDNRNAAANLSAENLVKFVSAAEEFMKKPGERYFSKQPARPLSAKETRLLQNRGTEFLAVAMRKPDLIEDVLFPQLRKTLKRIETVLEQNDFVVVRSGEFVNSGACLFFEIADNLPKIKKMAGPPIFSRKHTKEFLTKYKKPEYGPYIEGNRWVVEKNRSFVDAESFLKNLVKKDLVAIGVPENIAKLVKKSRIVYKNFWNFVKRDKALSAFLRERYFSRIRINAQTTESLA